MKQIGAKVMGESALIDKETGRIFWEGGSKTSVAASIAPMLSDMGLHRIKSSLLSIALFTTLLSLLARYMTVRYSLIARPITWRTAICLLVLNRTLLTLPKFDNWFVVTVIVLYFLEAYHCNTRRYLANAISSPDDVEKYIELLRQESPVVTWKVRCFHYERRAWASLLLPQAMFRALFRQVDSDLSIDSTSTSLDESFMTKKVVKHVAEANYKYKACIDNTIAGVWKRATASIHPPPFTKILLTKLIILGNDKARLDYFQQQAKFVTTEGQADEFAEFSTNIALQGFRPQLLAIHRSGNAVAARLFRLHMFWIFTALGLTLPFRIWFARHCDELRVTVAKETLAEQQTLSSKGWFGKSLSSSSNNDPSFRQAMQNLSLYGIPPDQGNNVTNATALHNVHKESDIMQGSKSWFGWSSSTNLRDISTTDQALQTLEIEGSHHESEVLPLHQDNSTADGLLQLLAPNLTATKVVINESKPDG